MASEFSSLGAQTNLIRPNCSTMEALAVGHDWTIVTPTDPVAKKSRHWSFDRQVADGFDSLFGQPFNPLSPSPPPPLSQGGGISN